MFNEEEMSVATNRVLKTTDVDRREAFDRLYAQTQDVPSKELEAERRFGLGACVSAVRGVRMAMLISKQLWQRRSGLLR